MVASVAGKSPGVRLSPPVLSPEGDEAVLHKRRCTPQHNLRNLAGELLVNDRKLGIECRSGLSIEAMQPMGLQIVKEGTAADPTQDCQCPKCQPEPVLHVGAHPFVHRSGSGYLWRRYGKVSLQSCRLRSISSTGLPTGRLDRQGVVEMQFRQESPDVSDTLHEADSVEMPRQRLPLKSRCVL